MLVFVQTACYAKPAFVKTQVKQAEAFDETSWDPGHLNCLSVGLSLEAKKRGAIRRCLGQGPKPAAHTNCLGGLAMRRVSLQLWGGVWDSPSQRAQGDAALQIHSR